MTTEIHVIIFLRTHAFIASIDLHVILRANTSVIAQCVIACAWTTEPRIHQTLINICRQKNIINVLIVLYNPLQLL